MSEPSAINHRRAEHVSALGFILQLAAYGTLLGVSVWSGSDAIGATSRLMLIGLPVWLVLFLVFKQMRRVSAEALETAELARTRAAAQPEALFGMDDEALLLEQNRLQWMVRFLLPAVTILLAILLLGGHFVGWKWTLEGAFHATGEGVPGRSREPTLVMWFVVFIGFLCFLYARYSNALSRLPHWRLLRAGAACMAGNAVACLGLAIALMASPTIGWAEPLIAYVIRIALIVLGMEFTANFILDLYRPRAPGVIPRPSFESRLLGLMSEPGGIARSIAEAVNYQFGFEVSSTWFYQLLQRWMFPIMVVTLMVIVALTSLVVVNADEQVVVERFGRLVRTPTEVLSPGVHFKWPYPVEVTQRAPVKRISELVVGEATEPDDEAGHKAILWTEAHDFVPELMLLVASPQLIPMNAPGPGTLPVRSESVAVSLLMVSVPLEYRIKDIKKYLYTYDEPLKLLECVAYRHLCNYAASVDIDQLMGSGREAFNERLQQLIQASLDELDVGIEVVFAGIRGAHPPATEGVAAAFQAVVSAQTDMAAMIHAAQGQAQRILITVAGTESHAQALDETIRLRDRVHAEPAGDPRDLVAARARVEELLVGAPEKNIAALSGAAAARIAEARATASKMVSGAQTKVRVFNTEVAAFQSAPTLYKQRKMLEVYQGLDSVRKWLIVGNSQDVIIEYETLEEGALDRVLQEGVQKK